jgi:hypothetical protein
MANQAKFEKTVTGVPAWLLRDYLVELGGSVAGDERVDGTGWSASLLPLEDRQVGSLTIGQVQLTLRGQPLEVARVQSELQKRLIRGGG